jgi:prepilin-type N-terminal cleavage/methylation domain-containing protein
LYSSTPLNAFTLSELLISLSILGLIAVLTLPSIISSVQQGRRNAVIKETINVLEVALQDIIVNHPYETDLNAIFKETISGAECSDTLVLVNAPSPTDPKGCVFVNGAIVYNINGSANQWDTVMLDWNGNDAPNTGGDDRITLAINYGAKNIASLDHLGTVSAYVGQDVLRPGEVKPRLTHRARYEEIFGAAS